MGIKQDKNSLLNTSKQLHNQVRERLERTSPTGTPTRSTQELLQELHVYQIELEMQNEALRKSRLELKISHDRYLDLYEFAPVGFITLTENVQIDEINLTGTSILGNDRSRITGRNFSLIVSESDRDYWHQLFTHTLKHGTHPACELMLKPGNGTELYAQLDGIRRLEADGVTKVRFAFTDITERKMIQAREERFRRILNNTQDMIFIFSPDTLRFEYLNQGAVKDTGYSRDELLQMSPLNLLPQISEAEYRAFIRPLVRGDKETIRFETEMTYNHERRRSVEVRLQLVHEQNRASSFVAIVRDITKRRRAERQLHQQKSLMQQVIDTDPNMIFVRNDAGRFILANQALADFFNIPVKALRGSNNFGTNRMIAEFCAHTDHDTLEKVQEVTITHSLNKEGKEYWFQTVNRPLPQTDGTIHILGISVDITGLKSSKNKLAASYSELQRLSLHLENVRAEERAQIGRNLHDEMGATLAALKMRIAWLSSRLKEAPTAVSEEIKHISDLISDGILTLRQVVSDLRPNLLDDVGLLAAIRDYVKRFQHDTDIECNLILPSQEFKLDEKQSITLFRIIQESLNNVSKHARARKVEICFMLQDEMLHLQIMDDGIGFDPELQTGSYGLLGIKERARMIGGKAEIVSTPGHGTRVLFSLFFPDKVQSEFDYS